MSRNFEGTDISAKQIAQAFFYKLSYDEEHNSDSLTLHDNEVSNLYLQKFLYFAQTMALHFFNKPLFIDDCEAWRLGPVIPNVYTAYNNYKELLVSPNKFPALDDFSYYIIDATLETVKGLSVSQLVEISREKDAAWIKFYKENVKHVIIPKEYLKKNIPKTFLTKALNFLQKISKYDKSLILEDVRSLEFLNKNRGF